MCLECSGIHRRLGVHISKVKSVNLDGWKIKWAQVKGLIRVIVPGNSVAIDMRGLNGKFYLLVSVDEGQRK